MGMRTGRVLSAITVMAVAMLGGAQSASANPVDLVCPVSLTATSTPGVGLLPSAQTAGGSVSFGTLGVPCSSVLTGTPYTSGTATITGGGVLGCVNVGLGGLIGNTHLVVPITWNNGDTSTLTADLTAAPGPVFVFTASVTSGALQGSTVTISPPIPTGLTGNCLLSPVTSFSALGIVAFTRL